MSDPPSPPLPPGPRVSLPPPPLTETVRLDADASRELFETEPARPEVPGYEVRQLIGRGAFGAVWLAEQVNTRARVAIKQYERRQADWPLMAREVEKLAALGAARNIVRLIEVNWDDDHPWFVMELLPGGSLADRLARGPLPVDQTVRLAIEIAHGLRQAHGVGVLHCDLKPGNILLDAAPLGEAEARLCDFGQARLATEETSALGTLYYMAPEQCEPGARPSAKWDVYAFGAVLFQMLTGHPPHRTDGGDRTLREQGPAKRLATYRELALRHAPRVDRIKGLGGKIDRDLADIVEDCLKPDPAERIPNAQVILDRFAARQRRLTQAPLMRLGLLAPILLSVLVLLAARRALPQVVNQSERALVQQTLEGDLLSARLLAAGLEQDLNVRMVELVSLSERRELIDSLATLSQASSNAAGKADAAAAADDDGINDDSINDDGVAGNGINDDSINDDSINDDSIGAAADDARQTLQRFVDGLLRDSQRSLQASGRWPDQSWFVADATGVQVARSPVSSTIGKRFHWRDYFHGRGEELDPATVPDDILPRSRPGISQPFRSRATGKYMVAIAVPVKTIRGEVVGVLARTVHLFALLDAWERRLQIDRDQPGEGELPRRLLALALTDPSDEGSLVRLLDHRWMTQERLAGLSDAAVEKVTAFGDRNGFTTETDYVDPIGRTAGEYGEPWLAAAAPVGSTGWVAIVQERPGGVVQPVERVKGVFLKWGLVLLAIAVAMLGGLWWWLLRLVRV